jgi:pimeloyl-ACP methyl ester carboxylesterase
MPFITSTDRTKLYYEEAGRGTPVLFVHEFAGDHRTWEPQLRHFSRGHRCVTFSARGYPPSDIPTDAERYGQDIARGDVIAIMDALGIAKAHIVGHSMGAYTSLHIGIRHPERCISVTAAGCGWGSVADPTAREEMRKLARENGAMFAATSMAEAAARYGDTPSRLSQKYKDPRGFAEFTRMMSEHSPQGHALTMTMVQARRPTLWDLEADLRRFSPPLLVIVGDEDDTCIEGSVFLKRTVPTAGLLVIPRSGHNVPGEEPAKMNAALDEFFAAAEGGNWLAHKPPR